MNINEFAMKLNGREIGNEITPLEEKEAKKSGFVVVMGYSDDGAELYGAIREEVGCYNGADILLDKDGLVEDCDCNCKYGRIAKEKAKIIEAIWDEEGYSWIYKTDIPHATFEIYEDRDKYCRGIVFDIKSLK